MCIFNKALHLKHCSGSSDSSLLLSVLSADVDAAGAAAASAVAVTEAFAVAVDSAVADSSL
jgi:hypothetical protein